MIVIAANAVKVEARQFLGKTEKHRDFLELIELCMYTHSFKWRRTTSTRSFFLRNYILKTDISDANLLLY